MRRKQGNGAPLPGRSGVCGVGRLTAGAFPRQRPDRLPRVPTIGVGDTIPELTVMLESREQTSLDALVAEGPILLLFYLFDWSST